MKLLLPSVSSVSCASVAFSAEKKKKINFSRKAYTDFKLFGSRRAKLVFEYVSLKFSLVYQTI